MRTTIFELMPSFLFRIIALWGAILPMACSQTTAPKEEEAKNLPMVLQKSKGKQILLGSTLWPSRDEQPLKPVSFTYDFYMSATEVPLGLYRQLMSMDPVPGANDSVPVHDVTWYDAVRFCNALSRSAGLDSFYQIQGNSETPDIRFLWESKGYRLPTEAEWVFAATNGKASAFPWGDDTSLVNASKFAWFAENSGGNLHQVGSSTPSSDLWDMAGNVMEWTQDLFTDLDTLPQENYAGAAGIAREGEVVVKGGSYGHSIRSLRTGTRKDIYATTPNSKFPYLGFRVAQGAIGTASFEGSKFIDNEIYEKLTEREQIREFFGTSFIKIAFTTSAKAELYFLDYTNPLAFLYSTGSLLASPIQHPTISPNGKQVAWSDRKEGLTGISKTTFSTWNTLWEGIFRKGTTNIEGLAQSSPPGESFGIPRWWVNPETSDTNLLVVSSTLPDKSGNSWEGEHTFLIPISQMRASWELAKELPVAGSYHGGLSANGQYLATGFPLMRIADLHAKTSIIPFTMQVCNISMAPDSSGKVMFLDFGSTTPANTVSEPYGIHARLFVADASGKILKAIPPPPGYVGWDHTEFSNDANFAIASVWDSTEERSAIYAVNLQTGKTLPLVKGRGVEHPSLWIWNPMGTHNSSMEDSLGFYHSGGVVQNGELGATLVKYWNRRDSLEVVMFGSSRMKFGIPVPEFSQNYIGMNLAFVGGHGANIVEFWDQYLSQLPSLKMIIFSVDPDLWTQDTLKNQSWVSSTGYLYDLAHNIGKLGLTEEQRQYMDVRFHPESYFGKIQDDGVLPVECGYQPWTWTLAPGAKPELDSTKWIGQIHKYSTWVRKLSAKGIKLVGVVTPLSPDFKNSPWFGRFGLPRDQAASVIARMKELDAEIPGFLFIDQNQMGDHDFIEEEFRDADHLCSLGGRRLADTLSSAIQREWPGF